MFGSNQNSFFHQPNFPQSAPASSGLGVNVVFGGGLPQPGINGFVGVPVSSSTTVWAMGGNAMPVAHPSVPTQSFPESQGSVGVTFNR